MEYKGKQYEEVRDGSARIGDLIHVTAVSVEKCDLWCLTTDDDSRQPYVDIEIPGAYDCLDIDADSFTRYRYVKDIEENSSFSVGDTVKIVGTSIEGYGEHIGNNAYAVRIFSGGDVRVSNKIGENNYMDNIYPPSSLKLIENNTEKAHRELNKTIIKIDKEMIKHLKKSKKSHDLINQTSNITTQTDNVNSPSHYTQTKYEAIDIIEDVTQKYQLNVQYHIGNAIKYLIRAPFKNNTVEELKKAVWYINRAVNSLEGVE